MVQQTKTKKKLGDDGGSPEAVRLETSFVVAVLERDQDEETFGWGRLQCSSVQCCQSPWCFLACLCLLSISSTYAIHGVFPAAITQLERRMNFGAAEIALIRISYDVGQLVAMFPFLVNAVRGSNRPQWIGIGGLIMTTGAIVCSLAHFSDTDLHATNPESEFCIGNRTIPMMTVSSAAISLVDKPPPCPDDAQKHWIQVFTLSFGFLLIGIGAAPIQVLGVTYLDENASHHAMSAVFTGIIGVSELCGPVLGFLTILPLLEVQGDIEKTGKFEKRPESALNDRNWYGAWWLGMYINALMSLIGTLWILAFPQELRGAAAGRLEMAREVAYRKSKSRSRSSRSRSRSSSSSPKNSPWAIDKLKSKQRWRAIMVVVKNYTFWGLVLEKCGRMMAVLGFYTFIPKYLETFFASRTPTLRLIGPAVICMCAILGLVVGTVAQRYFRLKLGGTLRLAMFSAVLSLLLTSIFAIDKCQNYRFAGVTLTYGGEEMEPSGREPKYIDACNSHCQCSTTYYSPACYYDNNGSLIYFYSPCYAGCSSKSEEGKDCKCVNASARDSPGRPTFPTGHRKKKPGDKCRACFVRKKAAIMIGLGWLAASAYIRMNPAQQAIIRCVPFKSRIVALAISGALMRLFGSIPGTFIVAELIDAACMARRKTTCHDAYCIWYNPRWYSLLMIGFMVCTGTFSLLGLVLALATHKKNVKMLDAEAAASSNSPSASGSHERSADDSSNEEDDDDDRLLWYG